MTLVRSVHTIGSIEPWVGGPARSVTSLARALEGLGARTTLVTAHPPGDDLPFAVLINRLRFDRHAIFARRLLHPPPNGGVTDISLPFVLDGGLRRK